MNAAILTHRIEFEQDVVRARQRARQIAELLGFPLQTRTQLATAVSEVSRNAFLYAGGGTAEFLLDPVTRPQRFVVRVSDRGPGIGRLGEVLSGRYESRTGLGIGLSGSRRLVDHFAVESTPGAGTTVTLGLDLPARAAPISAADAARIADALARRPPQDPLEEAQRQNQELLAALSELRRRDEQLVGLNRELATQADQLREAEAQLRARNDELKGFAYTVSHDLKAPLRGIAGYAQELDRKHRDGLGERPLFCLSQILTATRNLDRLIEDLLHYSRLDAEVPHLLPLSLSDVVSRVLADRRLPIEAAGAEVTVELGVDQVRGWERALVQVLSNLVDNALKYSRGAAPPRISIRTGAVPGGWRLTVEDNGIGFDMKYHDRIFGLFNRLVRAEEYDGTGAGLAIVRKLLDKQGGRIWAESEPGRGATFFVELSEGPSA